MTKTAMNQDLQYKLRKAILRLEATVGLLSNSQLHASRNFPWTHADAILQDAIKDTEAAARNVQEALDEITRRTPTETTALPIRCVESSGIDTK